MPAEAADNVCPNCGARGSVRFDQSSQAYRCSKCHVSKIDLIRPKTAPPTMEAPPASDDVVTNVIPSDARPIDVIRDRLKAKGPDGRMREREVSRFYVPEVKDVADLTIDAAWAKFAQHRLEESGLLANEKRYGRDWLHRHGYVHRHLSVKGASGKTRVVRLIVPPEMAEWNDDDIRGALLEILRELEKAGK